MDLRNSSIPSRVSTWVAHRGISVETLFGLRTYDQKISINKIASVRYLSGVIWGGISIESFGGAISNILINGLDKEEAQKTVSILDEIISKR